MSHARTHRFVFVLLIAALGISMGAGAADYYVSPSGKDTNSGSQSSPWQTINKVNSVNFSAGDRIFFQGGQTFSGKLYFDANDKGTAASPIVLTSYGTGRATINGGGSDALFAYNTAAITISNLNFSGTSSTGCGICFYNDLAGNVKLPHIYIDSVEIHGFKDGINIGAWNGVSGYSDVRITNASVHDNFDNNIITYGQSDYALTSVYIAHCQTYNSSGDPNQQAHSSGSGIVLGSVNGATIEHCISYNNGWLCSAPAGPCGIWCYESNAVTIQYNEAWDNHGINADGDGFDLDGDTMNSVMQYNYSHDNDGAGFLICEYNGAPNANANNVVRYNVSQNDGRARAYGAIHFYNAGIGLMNCEVYNNTIFVSPAAYGMPDAVNVYSPTTNVHIRNNILVTTGGAPLVSINAPQSGLSFDHNCYWSSGAAFSIQDQGAWYGDLASWRAASGQEPTVALNLNPLLANPGGGGTIGNADNLASLAAYKLLSNSPLIDAGLNLNSAGVNPGSVDYYGVSTPQGRGYDIGANETIPAVNQPPTVALTSPSNAATYTAPASITLSANAADSDGSISKVEFYAGGTLLGTAASSPYTIAWNNVAAGTYSISAKATDNLGASTTSPAVSITVNPQPINSPPVITSAASALPNPANPGTVISFSASAIDPDGDALGYAWSFGDGGSASGAAATHAFSAAGNFTATVTVSDGKGGTVSSSVNIAIQSVVTPTVHIAGVTMTLGKSKRGTNATATISVTDGNGAAVSGATISGAWSGLTSATVSGKTSTNGIVSFTSAWSKGSGTFTFTSTAINAPGFTYVSNQNAATGGSITTSGQVTLAATTIAPTTQPQLDVAAASDATVALGQPFKFKLPVPDSLVGSTRITTTATDLPAGVRVSSGYIGGRARIAGTFTLSIHYRGIVTSTDANGVQTKTLIEDTLPFTLVVTP